MAIKHEHTAVPDEIVQSAFWNANHTGNATPTEHGNEAHNPDFQDSATYAAHDHSAGDPTQVSHANLTNVSSDQHHARSHALTSSSDHTSAVAANKHFKANADGLPIEATNTDAEISGAVSSSHARQHSVTSTSDHTSTATSGKMLKANVNGLPIDATNTDADVADAVTKKHSQNTDTALGSGCEAVDHGAAATDMVVNVCYGTGDPPAANTTTEGTIYIKYTA